MEAGPRQGSPGLHRTFNRFSWAFLNLATFSQATVAIDTHMMIADTQELVANIHRNVLLGQESTSGINHLVGATCYLSTGSLPPSRLKTG